MNTKTPRAPVITPCSVSGDSIYCGLNEGRVARIDCHPRYTPEEADSIRTQIMVAVNHHAALCAALEGLEKKLAEAVEEIKEGNETIATQHRLMKNGEQRGIEKGREEFRASVLRLEQENHKLRDILSCIVRAESAGTDSFSAMRAARAVLAAASGSAVAAQGAPTDSKTVSA